MWAHPVVVLSPDLDHDLGFTPSAKPLQAQTLVAQFAVERFVGAVLPRLARIDERSLTRCEISTGRAGVAAP